MGDLINGIDILLYIVNIVILFFLLKFLLHKPISRFLAARSKKISDSLDFAEQEKQKAIAKKEEYDKLLAASQSEAAKIVAEGHERADKSYNEAVEQGKAEARQLIARAMREIEQERRAAIEGMRTEIADMAVQLAEKILEREISLEDNRKIIDEFFEKVG